MNDSWIYNHIGKRGRVRSETNGRLSERKRGPRGVGNDLDKHYTETLKRQIQKIAQMEVNDDSILDRGNNSISNDNPTTKARRAQNQKSGKTRTNGVDRLNTNRRIEEDTEYIQPTMAESEYMHTMNNGTEYMQSMKNGSEYTQPKRNVSEYTQIWVKTNGTERDSGGRGVIVREIITTLMVMCPSIFMEEVGVILPASLGGGFLMVGDEGMGYIVSVDDVCSVAQLSNSALFLLHEFLVDNAQCYELKEINRVEIGNLLWHLPPSGVVAEDGAELGSLGVVKDMAVVEGKPTAVARAIFVHPSGSTAFLAQVCMDDLDGEGGVGKQTLGGDLRSIAQALLSLAEEVER